MKTNRRRTIWTLIPIFGWLVAAAAVIGIGFLLVSDYRSQSKVTSFKNSLKDSGVNPDFRQFRKQSISDEDNAAILVESHKRTIQNILVGVEKLESGLPLPISEARLNPEKTAELGKLLDENKALIDELVRGGDLPGYTTKSTSLNSSDLIGQDLEQIQNVHNLTKLVLYDGYLKLNRGDVDGAVRHSLTILKWSDHLFDLPSLVSLSTAFRLRQMAFFLAAKSLQHGQVSKEACDELAAQLRRIDINADWKKTLTAEALFFLDSHEARNMSIPGSNYFMGVGEYVEYLNDVGDHGLFRKGRYIGVKTSTSTTVSIRLGAPSIAKVAGAAQNNEAFRRVLLAMLEVENAPAPLTKLDSTKLSVEERMDPFGQGDLVLSPRGTGIQIYSVGSNGLDDGGQFGALLDIGFDPLQTPATLPNNVQPN